MFTKIKNWIKENLLSFIISLIILIGFIVFIILLPKWAILTISAVAYLVILIIKIWKNKPF